MQCDPGHDERRDQSADVGAGVENARGQRALLLREPLGDSLDRCGKVAGFTNTQSKTRQRKARRRAGQHDDGESCGRIEVERRQFQPGKPVRGSVSYRGKAPQNDGEREADPCADFVHHPAREEQADGVGELETENNSRVNALVLPLKLFHECRLQNADDLAVDVIDGGGKEQQRANDPAKVAGAGK